MNVRADLPRTTSFQQYFCQLA